MRHGNRQRRDVDAGRDLRRERNRSVRLRADVRNVSGNCRDVAVDRDR